MKLKTGEDGNLVHEDGKIILVADDGTETPTDPAATVAALAKANAEAQKHRKAAKDAESRLKPFGDLDPTKAKEAIAFREALGEDFDADKATHQMAELKSQNAGLTSQIEERDATIAKQTGTIDTLSYDVTITGSEFVQNKLAPNLRTPERFRGAFGNHIDRDDEGRMIFKDATGNTIMSETNHGQPAGIDEALPKIATGHDLAAGNASGGGERGGGGNSGGLIPAGKKFSDLTAAERAAAVRKVGGDLEKLGMSASG